MATGKRRRLGEILLDAGAISEVQLSAALSEQRRWGGKLGRTLVDMGFVSEGAMARALSKQLQLPLVDLDEASLPESVTQLLRLDVVERYSVFPLGGDPAKRTLHIATADPTAVDVLQEISFHTGMKVAVSVCASTAIDRAVRRYYYGEKVVASDTLAPESVGMSENTFAEVELSQPNAAPLRATPPKAPDSPSAQDGSALADLARRLTTVEELVGGQARALRVLFEVLVEKKLVLPDEFQKKATRPDR